MRSHLGLFTDLYELTMMQGYVLDGRASEMATFDYFFRKNPFGGSYTIFAGLSDFLDLLPSITFSQDDIAYLRSEGFEKQFLDYLKDFQFSGDIFSVEEGTIVFPDEPVLSVRAPLPEAQLLETILLNVLNFQSLIATKACRIKQAAGDKTFIDFGLRRSQGWGGIAASKAAVIGGADATSNVLSAKEHHIPASGTMAHSWIQSYEEEYDAFKKFARIYKEKSILLVDTFDTLHSGVPNAIKVANEMQEEGIHIKGIRLDSGDFDKLSRAARKQLDDAGFSNMIIVVSNQQDEHTINALLSKGAPIDGFGVGTNLIVGRPDAALDGVYKLAVVDGRPSLKLSETVEKITVPGDKKLARLFDENGQMVMDAIQLLEEKEKPSRLMTKNESHIKVPSNATYKILSTQIVEKGNPLLPPISAKKVAEKVKANCKRLPAKYKSLNESEVFQTGLSLKLFELMQAEITKTKGGQL